MAPTTRWIYENSPLLAGVVIMTCSGSIYLTPVYQAALEQAIGLDESEISTVTTCVNAGTWLTVIPGYFYDRHGPKPTIVTGVVLLVSGYALMSAAAGQNIFVSPLFAMLFGFMYGHGSAWVQTAAVASSAANASVSSRGAVLGLLLGNFALSSGIYTQFYDLFFEDSVASFLLFTGLTMGLLCLIAYPSMNKLISGHELSVSLYPLLAFFSGSVVVLIVVHTFSEWGVLSELVLVLYAALAVAMIRMSSMALRRFGWLALSCAHTVDISKTKDVNPPAPRLDVANYGAVGASEEDALISPPLTNSHEGNSVEASSGGGHQRPAPVDNENRHDLTFLQAVQTIELWLLFVCFMCGVSGGITVLDNMTEIINSHSSKADDDEAHENLKTSAVALFSAVNAAGRVGCGMLTDSCRRYLSRSTFLCLNLLLMAGSLVLFAYVDLGLIYTATCFTAVAYGGMWMLTPALVADLFGAKSYGSIQGFMLLAACIGSEVFYNWMSVSIMDTYADDGGDCYNDVKCFRLTFQILAGICVFAAALALILAHRQRRMQESVQRQRVLDDVLSESVATGAANSQAPWADEQEQVYGGFGSAERSPVPPDDGEGAVIDI